MGGHCSCGIGELTPSEDNKHKRKKKTNSYQPLPPKTGSETSVLESNESKESIMSDEEKKHQHKLLRWKSRLSWTKNSLNNLMSDMNNQFELLNSIGELEDKLAKQGYLDNDDNEKLINLKYELHKQEQMQSANISKSNVDAKNELEILDRLRVTQSSESHTLSPSSQSVSQSVSNYNSDDTSNDHGHEYPNNDTTESDILPNQDSKNG